MIKGTANWTYDESVNCWYVGLDERASSPYRTQVIVEAVLDLDDDGRLAGIELVLPTQDGKPLLPPVTALKK